MEVALSIFSIIISTFIAYHIFFLSKRLSMRDKLAHQKIINEYISRLKSEIYSKKRCSRVYLVDADVYEKYYPNNDNKFGRYSHIRGEIKDAFFNGIEIITETINVVQDTEGKYIRCSNEKLTENNKMKAIKVGIIPYDWVIDINLKGDDTNGSALIYCYFRKKSNWKFERRVKLNKEGNMYRTKLCLLSREWLPFKTYEYYLLNPNFQENINYPWEIYLYPIKVYDKNR